MSLGLSTVTYVKDKGVRMALQPTKVITVKEIKSLTGIQTFLENLAHIANVQSNLKEVSLLYFSTQKKDKNESRSDLIQTSDVLVFYKASAE